MVAAKQQNQSDNRTQQTTRGGGLGANAQHAGTVGSRLLHQIINFLVSGLILLFVLAGIMYLVGDERLWQLLMGWLQYAIDFIVQLIPSAPNR